MAAETVDAGSEHPVLAALAQLDQTLDAALAASTWSMSESELREALVASTSLGSRSEALRGALLRESVARETPDARGEQGARTVNLLKSRCRVSPRRASADVENAKLTCPDTGTLRELGRALAAGAVSREHVDVARSALKRLPGRVVRERRDEVDGLLTEHARTFEPGAAEYLSRHLLSVITPDRADRYDENALDRRHLSVATDQTGMVLLSGQLDQCTGLKFATVLDHLVETDRATGSADGADGCEPDLRTRGQRRVDALGVMADAAAEFLGLGAAAQQATDEDAPVTRQRAARAVPRVVVVTTPEQLAGTEGAGAASTTDCDLVGRGAVTRIACDAVIDRVVLDKTGRVLAMDTLGRLATAAQQIALVARDRGCTWPGCTTPPSLCEAHHVDLVVPRRAHHPRQPRAALPPPPHPDPRPARRQRPTGRRLGDGDARRDPLVPTTRPPRPRPPVAAQHLPPDRPGHPRHRPALARSQQHRRPGPAAGLTRRPRLAGAVWVQGLWQWRSKCPDAPRP